MITEFKIFEKLINLPIDTSGSMSNDMTYIFNNTKATIYEVDSEENKIFTYKKMIVTFDELKQLIDLKLVFIDDDYLYSIKNRKKIIEIIEIARNANKFNL